MPSPPPTPSGETGRPARDVGRRIRDLRTASGVSLGTLAAESGLGKGTLSELERGQRNPTLETLYSIATALSVPLSHLLADPAAPEPRPVTRGASVEAALLDRWSDDTGLTEVYRVTLGEPIQRSQPHLPGVVETLTVTAGTAEVGAESGPAVITATETHTFPADVPHVYRAVGGPASGVLTIHYPAPRPDSDAAGVDSPPTLRG